MKFDFDCQEAEQVVSEAYGGDSKPFTKLTSKHNPQSLDFWLGNPRIESGGAQRVIGGMNALLIISSRSKTRLPPRSFPAVFEFSGGEKRLPDKGQIKALMQAGRLCARICERELIFQMVDD